MMTLVTSNFVKELNPVSTMQHLAIIGTVERHEKSYTRNWALNICMTEGDTGNFVSFSKLTRSHNGVKNHTFPASQIFHERITSTIMNF